MGRMLAALKNKETSRLGTRDKPFLEDAIEHLAGAETSADDGVPFIEVGGPNKKTEGSAQVMAVKQPGQPRVHPPHQPAEKMHSRPNIPTESAPARTMAVAFE